MTGRARSRVSTVKDCWEAMQGTFTLEFAGRALVQQLEHMAALYFALFFPYMGADTRSKGMYYIGSMYIVELLFGLTDTAIQIENSKLPDWALFRNGAG